MKKSNKLVAVLSAALLSLGGAFIAPTAAQAATHKIFVGATIQKGDIPYWQGKLQKNGIMRVFGDGDGTIANNNDARYTYAREVGMRKIFVSTKIREKFVNEKHLGTFQDGATRLKNDVASLVATGWFDTVYVADCHECEKNYIDLYGANAATQFKADQNAVFAAINTLPLATRAKVKVGTIATKQWTEAPSPKGNFNYKTFDTGNGDFWSVDVYHNSNINGNQVITSVDSSPAGVTNFLQYIKAYKYSALDLRPRIFPELGLIGFPKDTTGSMRAAWYNEVYNQIRTWDTLSTGWTFAGVIVWNSEGTHGAVLSGNPGIGDSRFFQLDRRHTGANNYTTLNPPLPLQKWNQIAVANN